MVISFKEITRNIKSDLDHFESLLNEISITEKDLLNEILTFIFETKGKRVRPVLVYLTARLFGQPNKSTHHAALLVELMHTATLLHDDVIDKATLRRGKQTINHRWDDKTAVLTGDFLFAKAMKLATDHKEYKLFDIITPAIISLSVGELQQMSNSANFKVSRDNYFEVIKKKTASLLSVCCESGAYTAGVDDVTVKRAGYFGEILGIIFQIKDDILDYVGNGETGKETGIDIREGKITLPLICAWDNMDESSKAKIVSLWDQVGINRSYEKVIIQEVIKFDGILEAEKIMKELKAQALEVLNDFPDTPARLALAQIIDYIIDRNK
jgi:octaprenyl-diphosphate synthase